MDRNYLLRAHQGDRAATDEVVDALYPRLQRMAAHFARHSPEAADDLLQEAWVGVLTALPEVDISIGDPE